MTCTNAKPAKMGEMQLFKGIEGGCDRPTIAPQREVQATGWHGDQSGALQTQGTGGRGLAVDAGSTRPRWVWAGGRAMKLAAGTRKAYPCMNFMHHASSVIIKRNAVLILKSVQVLNAKKP
uniref:Uncharacterized protein n=1 Tax=Pipistrellus kuhlii TaxID=59472 RepID=A0A7J8A883_PIPKU|nr:hypothetical protein mPipKuh1_008986 [Pipistrellus kuhlii]